jgi:lysophospholipase L1-like esterase
MEGSGRRQRAALYAGGLLLLCAAYVGLALLDVVPGGWRLRTAFVPQSITDGRKRAAHRAERLRAFDAEATPRDAVLFIGSSTIEYFDLERAFPGARAINRGIGDEDLDALTGRFLQTLHATGSEAVVLYAASVDFRRHATPPQELGARVVRLLDQALVTAPERRITLIGILPERSMDAPMTARLAATNEVLAALAAQRERVTFVPTDLAPVIDPETGFLAVAASRDLLHLNGRGYDALAGWLLEADPSLAARLRP